MRNGLFKGSVTELRKYMPYDIIIWPMEKKGNTWGWYENRVEWDDDLKFVTDSSAKTKDEIDKIRHSRASKLGGYNRVALMTSGKRIKATLKSLEDVMFPEHLDLNEDAPTVNAGGGQVAGIGIGAKGEPGRSNTATVIRRTQFAGNECFEVDEDRYNKARLGKQKFAHYKTYVGEDDVGKAIRDYGRQNPNKAIVLKSEKTGAMLYLKYGKQ